MTHGFEPSFDIAKYLILLSHKPQLTRKRSSPDDDGVFQCKTCNRTFPSFQALGGHRSSHKRARLTVAEKMSNVNNGDSKTTSLGSLPVKPKIHECSICGQGFSMGQALGGHMKHHRAAAMNNNGSFLFASAAAADDTTVVPRRLPVLRRSNSNKRVFGLDLNLTPLENDLEILFGKRAPKVDLVL